MALPKKKTSRSRRDKRRAHSKLNDINLICCPQCKKFIPSHRACPYCGTYKGRDILNLEAKAKKKKAKKKKEAKSKIMKQ